MIKRYHSRVPDGTEKQVHNVSLVVNTSDNDNTLDGSEIGHDVPYTSTYALFINNNNDKIPNCKIIANHK